MKTEMDRSPDFSPVANDEGSNSFFKKDPRENDGSDTRHSFEPKERKYAEEREKRPRKRIPSGEFDQNRPSEQNRYHRDNTQSAGTYRPKDDTSYPQRRSFHPNFDENNQFREGGARKTYAREQPNDGNRDTRSGYKTDQDNDRRVNRYDNQRPYQQGNRYPSGNAGSGGENRERRPYNANDRNTGFNRENRERRPSNANRPYDPDRRNTGFSSENRERKPYNTNDRNTGFNRENPDRRPYNANRPYDPDRRNTGFSGENRERKPYNANDRNTGFNRENYDRRPYNANRPYDPDRRNTGPDSENRERRPYNTNDRNTAFNRENYDRRPYNSNDRNSSYRQPNEYRSGYGNERRDYSDRDTRNNYRENAPRREGNYRGDRDNQYRDPSANRKPRNEYSKAKKVSRPPVYFEPPKNPNEPVRLNKYIAQSGICSRREADEYIKNGKISVNGTVVTEMGYKITPSDDVRFDGEQLKGEKRIYILMNKPKGFVTTVEDPHADKTVIDLLKDQVKERVYPVGRLDKNTLGVLLLTNDGELTEKLTHPGYEKKKIYHVYLDKPITEEHMEAIINGFELEDGFIFADEISKVENKNNEVGIELHSGRNRIVRRIFEHFGYKVNKLDRVYFAGLTKKGLQRGFWRYLSPKEAFRLTSGAYE